MSWFNSVVRIAGASFPGSASLVQLQAEIDSDAMNKRIEKLEDPISYLHQDIPTLSKAIYLRLEEKEKEPLIFDKEFYQKHSRALAALESQGYIKGEHAIGNKWYGGLYLCDPSFIMYLCTLFEDDHKMESLVKIVDSCQVGKSLRGEIIKESIDIPIQVIKAVFSIYESKGFGFCSKRLGHCEYTGKA